MDVVEAYETVIPRVFAATAARGVAVSQKRRPDWHYLYQFVHGAEFCGAAGAKPRPSRPRPRGQGKENRVRFASIGPITSSTLRELGLPVDVEAAEYTIPGLIKAIARFGF